MAKVIVPAALRRRMNTPVPEVEVSADTVGEALKQLTDKYPELGSALFQNNGQIRPALRIFIGERMVDPDSTLDESVGDREEILLLPPIAGG